MINPKQIAALRAIELVQNGQLVGLGTGSTASFAIEGLGKRIREGLRIEAVCSSSNTEALARKAGIPLIGFEAVSTIDIYIDGADEVDGNRHLIKGGGGALLREKMLAYASKHFIVIVDETKLVKTLGAFPLPVEIVPFAWELTLRHLAALGTEPRLRKKEGELFLSDNGHYIADCPFYSIADPALLAARIDAIPGIVESGLFVGMAERVVVGHADGSVQEIN